MIPFSFFPGWIQEVLNYLPFSGLSSTPVNIYLGNYAIYETLIKLFLGLGWSIIIYALSVYANHVMIKHAEAVGG